MKPEINFLFAEQTFGSHMLVCTLTLPGQNFDADLSENRIGFGLQNLPDDYQTIRIIGTLISDNIHDLNDTRGLCCQRSF